MKLELRVTTHEKLAEEDRSYWLKRTPGERLSEVERLRMEAGKFLYDYPARLQRVVKVTRRERS